MQSQAAGKKGVSSEGDKLLVKSDGKIHIVPFDDIVLVEAYDYYVRFHVGNKMLLSRDTLTSTEEMLDERFVRVHRSYVVNLRHVKSMEPLPNREYTLEMSNGEKVRVSRNWSAAFLQRFN